MNSELLFGSEDNDSLVNPRLARLTALVMLIVLTIAGAVFGHARDFGLGLLLGGGIAILLFRLQEITIGKILGTGNKALAILNYLVRMAIRAAALIISIKREDVSILATVLGLLSVNWSIYVLAFIEKGRQKKEDAEHPDKEYVDYTGDESWNTAEETPGSMFREIRDEIMK